MKITKNGYNYKFTITSEGLSGERWIQKVHATGLSMTGRALDFLRSSSFKPTKAGTLHRVVLTTEAGKCNEPKHTVQDIIDRGRALKCTPLHPEVILSLPFQLTGKQQATILKGERAAVGTSTNITHGDTFPLLFFKDNGFGCTPAYTKTVWWQYEYGGMLPQGALNGRRVDTLDDTAWFQYYYAFLFAKPARSSANK